MTEVSGETALLRGGGGVDEGMNLPEMTRITHTQTKSATHHGHHKIPAKCNLCFLLVIELDSSAREKTTRRKLSEKVER